MQLVHLIFRQWKQRPGRFLMSAMSVAIAVGAVLATLVARENVRAGYDEMTKALEGEPVADVVAAAGGRFDDGYLDFLDGLTGVEAQIPMASRAAMARIKGKRMRAVVIGTPPQSIASGAALELQSGKGLESTGDAVVAADLIKSMQVKIGDRLTLLTRRGPRTCRIAGFAAADQLDALTPGARIVVSLADLQEWFRLEGQIDRVRLKLATEPPAEEIRESIRQALPVQFALQAPASQLMVAESVVRSSELALQFASALSIAMAAFVVFNSLRMSVGERRKELATLRLLGATQRQIGSLYLLEGSFLGILGAVLGAPAGIKLASSLSAVMGAMNGTTAPSTSISWTVVATALGGGLVAAAVAGALPALNSRGISPREAFEGMPSRQDERSVGWSAILGATCWLPSVGLMVLVVTERAEPSLAIPAGLGMLLGFVAFTPVLLKPIVSFFAAGLDRLYGVESTLAAGQILNRRDRAGLTVGVMVVAVSNGLGLGNAVLTNIEDVQQWHRRAMAGDVFLINPDPSSFGEAADPLMEELRGLPSVGEVAAIHFLSGRARDLPVSCIVRNFPEEMELPWTLSAAEESRTREALTRGGAVVSEVLARRLGALPGDVIRLEVRGSAIQAPIIQLVTDYNSGGLVAYLDREFASSKVALGAPDVHVVKAERGVSAASLASSLSPWASEKGLSMRSFDDLQAEIDRLMNGIVGALWGLMGIGFVVAAFAIANTLNIGLLEQTRELGLLRVLGLTRRQLTSLVFIQAVLLAIPAAICGLAAGLTTAGVIHLCTEPVLGHHVPFKLHLWLVAVNGMGCLPISLLAALPALIRLRRLSVLGAIAYE